MTFVFARVPLLDFVEKPVKVSRDAAEGLTKLEGTDRSGKVKVWARNLTTQPFRQVGAVKDYYLAKFFVDKMNGDESERRRALRDAKHIRFDP